MTYIVAEISGNHGGYLYRALELIETAAGCGADAVKFQLYKPEDLRDPANNEIYEKSQVPTDWLRPMFDCARACRIDLFASVFAPWAVEALAPFKPEFYKIASPESTRLMDYEFIVTAIRGTGIPIVWSTGRDMSWFEDLSDWDDWTLYCKQGYPATIDLGDLLFIHAEALGFSDHTAGIMSTLAAIAVGADMIEKHFKLNNDCVDAAFSIDPVELRALCDLCS